MLDHHWVARAAVSANVLGLWRCRQQATGDQLRVIYDQLSKDPNSLANLDQDLPNYAQHQIPIYSLPPVRRLLPQKQTGLLCILGNITCVFSTARAQISCCFWCALHID